MNPKSNKHIKILFALILGIVILGVTTVAVVSRINFTDNAVVLANNEPTPNLLENEKSEEIDAVEVAAISVKAEKYGEPHTILDNSESINVYISYPVIGIDSIDKVISEWATNVYDKGVKELNDSRGAAGASEMLVLEINVQYNTHNIGNMYLGIEEIGFYSASYLAHPTEFFKTFNVDLDKKELLDNTDIIDPSMANYVISLVAQKVTEKTQVDIDLKNTDSSWLAHMILTDDGIDVFLERGQAVPAYLGYQRVHLSLAELGDSYLLEKISTVASVEKLSDEQPSGSANIAADSFVVDEITARQMQLQWINSLGERVRAYLDDINIQVGSPPTDPPSEDLSPAEIPTTFTPPDSTSDIPTITPTSPITATEEHPPGSIPDLPGTPPATASQPTSADDGRKKIALTFDDGPSEVTPHILELLDANSAKATFCVVGSRISTYRDIMNAVAEQGSEIIGHSWNHKEFSKLSEAEIKEQLVNTNDAIFNTVGYYPKLYRPPYGSANAFVKEVSAGLGLSLINWSVDTSDWKTRNANSVYDAVMSGAKDGAVVLCHDIYATTGQAMERVIPQLISDGYALVTVSELFGFDQTPPEPGTLYYNKR
ncbi:MAG: polysaccharide deacetylase family protein [Clostridiales bacterium]|nr:polysaccharide deacetylase family protein [Clostridiales bacterium]